MEVRILGPLEVWAEGGLVTIDTPKERAVLEVLAIRAGDIVEPSVLVDALWGADPPRTAAKTLQSHVSRLRSALPDDVITTEDGGYRLVVAAGEDIDAARFERLIDAGRQSLEVGDHHRAANLFERALELWRGPPLSDVAATVREGAIVRLDELRVTGMELRIDALVASGHHDVAVPELEALVAEHPLRERFWEQLMLALFRGGRRGDALAAYQRLRRTLVEELGIDPSASARDLESRILDDDPTLEPPATDPPCTLPTPLTSFVGREVQRVEVRKLLADHRLVTLLGPGGVGKSRLAIDAARDDAPRWNDGVWWVELDDLAGTADLIPRFVRALELTVPPGVSPDEALRWFLAGRRLLLVIDNAERQAAKLAQTLGDLLEAAPTVTAMVTSRIPLGMAGEQRFVVPPLEIPEPGSDGALQSESMRLFLERFAERGTPSPTSRDHQDIAELCRLAEGSPLAIELVAACAGSRGPAGALADLADRHALLELEQGSGEVSTSLEHALNATIDLLPPGAKALFARLSVFRGAFDRDAALSVTTARADAIVHLDRLVDAALVMPVDAPAAQQRFRLLDISRTFATTLLDPIESLAATRRHAEHYRRLVIEAGPEMEGPDEHQWLERLRHDASDIDAAIAWWLDHEPTRAVAFGRAMGRAWYVWGDLRDACTRLGEMLDVAPSTESSRDDLDVAWTHLRLGWPRFLIGDVAGGFEEMDAAAAGFGSSDDPLGLARALGGRAHMTLLATGDTDSAMVTYEKAIVEARRSGNAVATAWTLVEAAQALILADRLDHGIETMLSEAEEVFAAAGDDVGLSHLSMDRVMVAYARDDLDEVRRSAENGLVHSRAAGHAVYEQILLLALGVRLLHLGDTSRSAELLADGARLAFDTHNFLQLGVAFQAMSAHAAVVADPEKAARLWGAAKRLSPVWPLYQRRYGELMAPARRSLGASWSDQVAAGAALSPVEALELGLGE